MNTLKFLFLVPLLSAMTGCEVSTADDFDEVEETRFENNASVSVTVTPEDGESFDAFTLEPGQRSTVDRNGDSSSFTFVSEGEVVENEISDSDVVFTDPL